MTGVQTCALPIWLLNVVAKPVELFELMCSARPELIVMEGTGLGGGLTVLALRMLRGIPYVVAVNRFPETGSYPEAEVRDALALRPDCPIAWIDARDPDSGFAALHVLLQHALARAERQAPSRPVAGATAADAQPAGEGGVGEAPGGTAG